MKNILWPASPDLARPDAPRSHAGQLTRRIIGVLCIVGYFCSTLEESILSTVDGSQSPAKQLVYISAHLSTISGQVVFELLTPLFVLGMVFTLVGAIRARGVWLASAAGVLGALGALAMMIGAATHLVALLLIQSRAQDSAIEAVLSVELPDAIFFLFFAIPLALLLLAAAAWRARLTTWIPFALVVVYVALDVSQLLPEAVPLVLGFIAFAIIGWGVLRIGTGERAALGSTTPSGRQLRATGSSPSAVPSANPSA